MSCDAALNALHGRDLKGIGLCLGEQCRLGERTPCAGSWTQLQRPWRAGRSSGGVRSAELELDIVRVAEDEDVDPEGRPEIPDL